MKCNINNAGSHFTLLENIYYPMEGVLVPQGFVTDFASVPKIFWAIYPPLGYYQHAALLHDFLYHRKGVLPDSIITRRDADRAFLRQMKYDGVGWRTRWCMYYAVRLFGPRW